MAGKIVKKCPCLRPKIEQEVRVLDYRHSSLTDMPSEVFNVERTLEELYADNNQIRDLPRELFYCHGLRKLSVSDNEITNIPPAISSLANLEELDFSKNGIIEVPDSIKSCKYLRSINASVNPLGKLPEGFTQLSNLTSLCLNDTFLDYLPGSFGRMVKLKILELRENHLKTLPRSFERLVELERLDIGNNEFTELTDVVSKLRSLLELWCDNNQITTVAHGIGQLKQLMFMDASNNKLLELPGELEGCTALADLHLTNNNLLSLPESIGNLTNLTTLKVDDNQLTSLPKSLGGLLSLSELNVSANDLEDLPPSIGLLRNLRTFYADENFLQYIPTEMGSCSGITVMSLRGNKLTYIPDELGRIPRLRVLNLSDNLLRYLPFTFTKLRELQALWLTESQTRPLIPLQSEHEPMTGRKILTCYLLPQGELQPNDERDLNGDTESFHASMWDEERLRRQQIHFDFIDDSEDEVRLVRCPTPYPKEMREKVRHARNLAMKQIISMDGADGSKSPNLSGRSVRMYEHTDPMNDYISSRLPEQAEVRVLDSRISAPASLSVQESSHRLHRYDKEKLLKDKAKMHRLSVPELNADEVASALKEERKGRKVKMKDESFGRHSGSVPDLTNTDEEKDTPALATIIPLSATYEDLYYKQFHSHNRKRRTHRTRDYDSDTGYRSDREISHFSSDRGRVGGGNSEVISVRSQPLPSGHRHRGRCSGYGSDLESYTHFGTANAAAAAYQQIKQSSHSHITIAGPSPNGTPNMDRNHRPTSPNMSEPRSRTNQTIDISQIPRRTSSNSNTNNKNIGHSHDYYGSNTIASVNRNDSSDKLDSFQPAEHRPVYSTPNFQISRLGPPVAPKPNSQAFTENTSHSHSPSSTTPTFHDDSFVAQSTPIQGHISSNLNQSLVNQHGANLYPLVEEKLPNQIIAASSSSTSTPPPYPAAPPYRRQRSERLSSDSSSSRVDSPRTNNLKLPQSRSSPCGFHGSNPYSDLPSGREKLSYSDYVDIDGHAESQSRSGSSSSHIGSASQIGYISNHNQTPPRSRERSNSSDSRSEHNRSMSRESPYPSGNSYSSRRLSQPDQSYYQQRPSSRTDQNYLHTRPSSRIDQCFHSQNYEDLGLSPNQEQSSQVSGSTDSGYGPGHHVYERIGDVGGKKGPGSNSSGTNSTPPLARFGGSRMSSFGHQSNLITGQSREMAPVLDELAECISQEHTEEFRVSIHKNPGLGFSIAGGLGSRGNPFRPEDKGIFVTKVIPDGPAAKYLQPGDKILEVNKVNVRHIGHTIAVEALKSNSSVVELLVERIQTINMV